MIVVCGEALVDLVPAGDGTWRALPGGSPANTAVALARLSTPTAMLARLATDSFGRQLRQRFDDSGVDLRYAVPAREPTALAIVEVDDSGVAQYTFHIAGTADWQWSQAELPPSFGDEVVAIHAGSMALAGSPGGVVLEGLLAREKSRRIISLDPNVRPVMCPDPLRYRESVDRWLSLAHIVKASADDVAWLYPGRPFEEVAADWAGRGPVVVVLTLGPAGALACTATGISARVPGIEVEVADSIGAGDAFTAGLLHCLQVRKRLDPWAIGDLTPAELEAALRFATRAAAITCTRKGADPPYLYELFPTV